MPGGWGDAIGGAGKGAAIGSFIPGIGTGIGAGIGAGVGWLFGGGDDKKNADVDDDNPETQYTNLLKQASLTSRETGNALLSSGKAALDPALQYFKSLLSSNPAAIEQATQMERGKVIDQYDTARRSLSTFGTRGGGTTGALASSQFSEAESLADITAEAKSNAATGAAAAGTAALNLGLDANRLASADLNTIINSVLAREGLDTQRRGQNMALAGDVGETIGTLIGIFAGGGDGGDAGPINLNPTDNI